jgi:hypothetical protein
MVTAQKSGILGSVPVSALKIKAKSSIAKSILLPSEQIFSAQVTIHYGTSRELKSFTVQFLCNDQPIFVQDQNLFNTNSDTNEESAFRFFDWKNPIWMQINGTIIKDNQTQVDTTFYTQAFTFIIQEDIVGIDYFGLRLKKGMFDFQCHDNEVNVIYCNQTQRMTFDTPYFILNPKDSIRDLIQIKQDQWMPLLVSAYALGSAVERRRRPYFSQAIERIKDWFHFMLGCKRNETAIDVWNETIAIQQLIKEMLRELWDKGPRRLIAFYSGMGYVFNVLNLADIAADIIYDFHTELSTEEYTEHLENNCYVSPRLFTIMLLLGLRTEKARLYVTIDLTDQSKQESHTQKGIRELLETNTLTNLFFAPQGKTYAPISIPKSFELHWGQLETKPDTPNTTSIIIEYKREIKLLITFTSNEKDHRYSIALSQLAFNNNLEWLGQIVIKLHSDTNQIHFISESITSNFRHLRNINAFKYILLVGSLQYVLYILNVQPQHIIFAADFFDHCAPYDLLLLQQFGWEPAVYDLSGYNVNAMEISPYSGRAMTLPAVRIPSQKKHQSSLVVYVLGTDRASVAIDENIYKNFIAQVKQQQSLFVKIAGVNDLLIDGIPRNMVNVEKFNQTFTKINHFHIQQTQD